MKIEINQRADNSFTVSLVNEIGETIRENAFHANQPNAKDRAHERAETWTWLYGCK